MTDTTTKTTPTTAEAAEKIIAKVETATAKTVEKSTETDELADTVSTSLPIKKRGSWAINIGIGMLLGLIFALIVAYFAMSSGPFRDKSNKNQVDPNAAQGTDPNTPLFSNNPSAPVAPSNAANPNAPANPEGIGAILAPAAPANAAPENTGTPAQAPAQPAPSINPPAAVVTPSAATTTPTVVDKKPTKPEAKPAPAKKPADPIADIISRPKPVTPTTIDNKPAAPKASTSTGAGSARYTIQAGSYTSENEARAHAEKLAAQGQSASVSKKQTSEGAVYRVRVGNYDSAKEAQSANDKVKGVVLDVTP